MRSFRWPAPRAIVPRLELDFEGSDFLAGLVYLLAPLDARRAWAQLEAACSEARHVIACLSVRSGFDLLLDALELPADSEILMSAINIEDMARVAEARGLKVVPIDLDYDTLAPRLCELERLITPRTRLLLVAHLFGSRVNLRPYLDFAAQHGLQVIEDCAQAFGVSPAEPDPRILASLTSFGPIKTATALGGALVTVRDPKVLARMRASARRWPVQTRRDSLQRLLRYGVLRLISNRRLFGLVIWCCDRWGVRHDDLLNRATRSFPAHELFAHIRRQPSAPQLCLLRRRLARFDPRRVRLRGLVGGELASRLVARQISVPGSRAANHSFWVFPINAEDPERLTRALLDAGFDASPGASAMTVLAATERQDVPCPVARQLLRNVVYLPIQAEFSRLEVDRLANVVADFG